MIEERGANLSGGQRQRIAIARALATNPPHPDLRRGDLARSTTRASAIIQRNMRRIVKDRTVIIIAHRLAAVRGCDRIVGIADGRIVEVGTHDELVRRPGGLYAYLWGLQGGESEGGRGMRATRRSIRPRRLRAAGRLALPLRVADAAARPRKSATGNFSRPPSRSWRRPRLRCVWPSCWIICALVVVGARLGLFRASRHHRRRARQVSADGRVKVVEPLETGRVEDIRVGNGVLVQAGDVLVELDRSAAQADVRDGARAELASARGGNPAPQDRSLPRALAPFAPPPGDRMAGQRRRRSARARRARSRRRSRPIGRQRRLLRRRTAQKGAERDELKETIATQKNLVATLQERVDMRTKLVESQAGAKAAVIDATETLQYQITQEAKQEQDWPPRPPGSTVIARNSRQGGSGLHCPITRRRLEDAERHAEETRQRLAKAQAQLDHLTLRAPIDGPRAIVDHHQCRPGGHSGQEIMRIVPEDSGLEIQAYVRNHDIGFVSVGAGGGGQGRILPVHPLRRRSTRG